MALQYVQIYCHLGHLFHCGRMYEEYVRYVSCEIYGGHVKIIAFRV